jgi:hypothetical protein
MNGNQAIIDYETPGILTGRGIEVRIFEMTDLEDQLQLCNPKFCSN